MENKPKALLRQETPGEESVVSFEAVSNEETPTTSVTIMAGICPQLPSEEDSGPPLLPASSQKAVQFLLQAPRAVKFRDRLVSGNSERVELLPLEDTELLRRALSKEPQAQPLLSEDGMFMILDGIYEPDNPQDVECAGRAEAASTASQIKKIALTARQQAWVEVIMEFQVLFNIWDCAALLQQRGEARKDVSNQPRRIQQMQAAITTSGTDPVGAASNIRQILKEEDAKTEDSYDQYALNKTSLEVCRKALEVQDRAEKQMLLAKRMEMVATGRWKYDTQELLDLQKEHEELVVASSLVPVKLEFGARRMLALSMNIGSIPLYLKLLSSRSHAEGQEPDMRDLSEGDLSHRTHSTNPWA